MRLYGASRRRPPFSSSRESTDFQRWPLGSGPSTGGAGTTRDGASPEPTASVPPRASGRSPLARRIPFPGGRAPPVGFSRGCLAHRAIVGRPHRRSAPAPVLAAPSSRDGGPPGGNPSSLDAESAGQCWRAALSARREVGTGLFPGQTGPSARWTRSGRGFSDDPSSIQGIMRPSPYRGRRDAHWGVPSRGPPLLARLADPLDSRGQRRGLVDYPRPNRGRDLGGSPGTRGDTRRASPPPHGAGAGACTGYPGASLGSSSVTGMDDGGPTPMGRRSTVPIAQ